MSSSSTDAALVDVTMPQMGVSVSEGTVVEWRKQVGDEVARDETICEISTDKIDTEVPSPAAGRVAEILVEVGETVAVGTVLARLAGAAAGGGGQDVPTSEAAAATGATPAEATDSPAPEPEAAVPDDAPSRGRGATRATPVVARIAAEHNIDLSTVKGTGRGGRVRKQDVLALVDGDGAPAAPSEPPLHIESPYRPEPAPPKPAAPAPGGEPLSRMRRSIGEHMKRSLELAAHCTTIVECDMSGVERRRRELGTTYLPIVARCTVEALREFSDLNAWLEGETFTRHGAVHLGIAVSLAEDGLIVPVVHDANELSDEGLARRITELARGARDRKLSPDDVRGGTFTITNPGAFGAIAATPIINQPQVAILDLEAVVKRPVVVTGANGQDAIAIRPMANLCLSWDHRAIDGAYAARFLTALRGRIEAV
ncbi:MAG TPA: dihydrolipoamide acetyltransferase family protein [Solirubrobacteraceae bacterium]|nr:dihydrolipoamide acetyltransferase family protein [Solirubrobacteraceae bacterium]